MLSTAVGFLAFYSIEKLTALHVGHETATELEHGESAHRHVGLIGASGMSLHSFLDGVALAAGLTVGGGLGLVIAAVVIIHRFSDGVGIVSLLLASRFPRAQALRWVLLAGAACNDAAITHEDGRWAVVGDPTEGAMLVAAA